MKGAWFQPLKPAKGFPGFKVCFTQTGINFCGHYFSGERVKRANDIRNAFNSFKYEVARSAENSRTVGGCTSCIQSTHVA